MMSRPRVSSAKIAGRNCMVPPSSPTHAAEKRTASMNAVVAKSYGNDKAASVCGLFHSEVAIGPYSPAAAAFGTPARRPQTNVQVMAAPPFGRSRSSRSHALATGAAKASPPFGSRSLPQAPVLAWSVLLSGVGPKARSMMGSGEVRSSKLTART